MTFVSAVGIAVYDVEGLRIFYSSQFKGTEARIHFKTETVGGKCR